MATMADNEKWLCSVCKKPGVFLCSRCRHPYCSPKCQSDDWPEHKGNCFPMPKLIKSDVKAVVPSVVPQKLEAVLPQKLETNLNVWFAKKNLKHLNRLGPLRKPRKSTDIETCKVTTDVLPQKLETNSNVGLPKERFSQLAPLRKPKISADIGTDTVTTANVELTKGYSFQNQFVGNRFYPGFQVNVSMQKKEQIDNEIKISENSLREMKIESVSTKHSDLTSNLFEVPPNTTSEPFLELQPKQVKAANNTNEMSFPFVGNTSCRLLHSFTTLENAQDCNNLLGDTNNNISTAPNVQAKRSYGRSSIPFMYAQQLNEGAPEKPTDENIDKEW